MLSFKLPLVGHQKAALERLYFILFSFSFNSYGDDDRQMFAFKTTTTTNEDKTNQWNVESSIPHWTRNLKTNHKCM